MRILIIGSGGTMDAKEAERYFIGSAAAATALTRPDIPALELDMPFSQEKKRGKYWESPKYKFTGRR